MRHRIKLVIYHHFQLKMPRQPLGEISGNSNYRGGVLGRFELTPHWRSHIVGRAAADQSQKAIAKPSISQLPPYNTRSLKLKSTSIIKLCTEVAVQI